MINLLDVLISEYPVEWFIARVEGLSAGFPQHVDLVVGPLGSPTAIHMEKVPHLASYAPSVDDVVHGIKRTTTGALVLGSIKPAQQAAGGGASVSISGHVPTAAQLPAGQPDGATWLVDATGDLYVWHSGIGGQPGSWADLGHIVGPRGLAGAKGNTGAAGSAGAPGPTGPIGPRGLQGMRGVAGANGGLGPPGVQGPTGPTGPKGDTGDTGATGSQGPMGPGGGGTGPAGAQGAQGVAGPTGPIGPNRPPRSRTALPDPGSHSRSFARDRCCGRPPFGRQYGRAQYRDGAKWTDLGHIEGPQGPAGSKVPPALREQ